MWLGFLLLPQWVACSSQDKVPYFFAGELCASCPADEWAVVSEVVDGDTLRFEGDTESTRLLGVDTPEIYTDDSVPDCYGGEASDFSKAQLQPGDQVLLQFDVETTDVVGRGLAYVFYFTDLPRDYDYDTLQDTWRESGGKQKMLNLDLLSGGFARIISEEAFIAGLRYEDILRDAEATARDNSVGLWSACEES